MRSESWDVPDHDGVYGPTMFIGLRSGRACAEAVDGSVVGLEPDERATNAFSVLVGIPVIVVSEGVEPQRFDVISRALRELVGGGDIPVVFHVDGATPNSVRVSSVGVRPGAEREVAKAVAYVLVQCAWVEDEWIRVELDGRGFEFRLEFRPQAGGTYIPILL